MKSKATQQFHVLLENEWGWALLLQIFHHPQPHPKSLKYWNIFEILILPEKRAKTERGGPFDNILDPQVKIKYRPLVGHDNKQYFHPS